MYDEHENGMKAWLKYILDSSNYQNEYDSDTSQEDTHRMKKRDVKK